MTRSASIPATQKGSVINITANEVFAASHHGFDLFFVITDVVKFRAEPNQRRLRPITGFDCLNANQQILTEFISLLSQLFIGWAVLGILAFFRCCDDWRITTAGVAGPWLSSSWNKTLLTCLWPLYCRYAAALLCRCLLSLEWSVVLVLMAYCQQSPMSHWTYFQDQNNHLHHLSWLFLRLFLKFSEGGWGWPICHPGSFSLRSSSELQLSLDLLGQSKWIWQGSFANQAQVVHFLYQPHQCRCGCFDCFPKFKVQNFKNPCFWSLASLAS